MPAEDEGDGEEAEEEGEDGGDEEEGGEEGEEDGDGESIGGHSVLNSRKNYFPDFLSSCVFVFLSFCLFVYMSFCLSAFLSFRHPFPLPFCLSVIVSFCHSSSSGCVIEDQMNYKIHNLDNVTNPTTQESAQACAEHCAASEGGRFWTYNKENKACWLKTSDSKKKKQANAISGSRACGLSKQLVLSD